MKGILITVILNLFFVASRAQGDSSAILIPDNGKLYASADPSIKYSYHEKSQILDFSGNWDFDGDGQKDSLFFIGNGGAHLYYHLRLVLSIEKKARDFPFLVFDLLYLGEAKDLNTNKGLPLIPQWVVHDFNGDGIEEIYLNTDINFCAIPRRWRMRGLTSRHILMGYKNGHVFLKNFR